MEWHQPGLAVLAEAVSGGVVAGRSVCKVAATGGVVVDASVSCALTGADAATSAVTHAVSVAAVGVVSAIAVGFATAVESAHGVAAEVGPVALGSLTAVAPGVLAILVTVTPLSVTWPGVAALVCAEVSVSLAGCCPDPGAGLWSVCGAPVRVAVTSITTICACPAST